MEAFLVRDFELGYSLREEGVEPVLVEFCHDAEARPLEEEIEVLVILVLLRLVTDFRRGLLGHFSQRIEFQSVSILCVLIHPEVDRCSGAEQFLVESLRAHTSGLGGLGRDR